MDSGFIRGVDGKGVGYLLASVGGIMTEQEILDEIQKGLFSPIEELEEQLREKFKMDFKITQEIRGNIMYVDVGISKPAKKITINFTVE